MHIAPLVFFRVFFGLLMAISLLRFWSKGWIESLYIEPAFHFKYYGFSWVHDWGEYTYFLFAIAFFSSLGVALGLRYRLSAICFFLSFTYIELIDKTTYLNHYYFTSCIAFLLCFLPAGKFFSLDVFFGKREVNYVPRWMIDALRLFVALVYFYAGIAKINSDWLLKAQPLSIWLTSKYDLPWIGELLQQTWVHYAASWSGMLYDVLIPFFLFYPKTRRWAFVFVLLFHLMTKIFFPSIGMFPYIMVFSALLFFSAETHKNILFKLSSFLFKSKATTLSNSNQTQLVPSKALIPLFTVFLVFQLLFPFRYALYPGELFWNEEGYRYSWRVMLMEKKGNTTFKVKDSLSGKFFYVKNEDFLTPFQEKQMSFQPDFILEYAHYLGEHFEAQGHKNIQIFADSYVALNGRSSQRFVNPDVNLLLEKESFKPKKWVLPFQDEIKGL